MTKSLQKYVYSQQGVLNQQLATIDIPLASNFPAEALAQELKNSCHVYDINLRLKWDVSVKEVQDLLRTFARSGAVAVHIDGVNPDTCQRLSFRFRSDLGDLQFVRLINYPRPFEQFIYLRKTHRFVYCLHLSDESEYDWLGMSAALQKGRELITEKIESPVNADTILQQLSTLMSPLHPISLKGIGFLDLQTTERQGWLKVQDGSVFGLTEITLPNYTFPSSLLECGTLLRLRAQTSHSADLHHIRHLLNLNGSLKCVEFPVQDGPILRHLGHILRNQPKDSSLLRIDLFETRTSDEKLFASLIVEKTDTQGSEYSMVTNILEWRCSHVTGIKGDRDVAILDMASLRFPSVMISLSLDITTLTERGLACVRNIFQQSPLENLRIHCTSIGPILERHLGPALLAIPWSTITAFALHSGDIDSWFYLWEKKGGMSVCVNLSQLLSLEIFGAGVEVPPLSHATILSIHNLICHAPLLQLSLENIYVPQEQDWDLIIKVVDFSRLMCLSLVNSNIGAMKPWISQLREQLTELDLVYFTSVPGESSLTFVSCTSSATEDEYTSQSSYRSMLIDGVCVLDHENDLQQGLFPGFLDCYVESAGHNNMSGRTILKANVLHQAIVRNNLGKSVSRPYKVYRLRDRSGVQEVILPTMEKDILSRIGQLRQFWSGKSGQLLAELVVKEKPSCKVVVAIGEKLTMGSVGGAVMQGASDTIESEAYIKVLEWDLEHVSKPLSDENAAVLNMISSQRPLVLKHFALDITFLTDHGLASLRNVLQRSRLKSVRVNCGPIQPEGRETLYLLLKSMNKSTLQSLILEGNNVDGWLRLWGTIEELPRWQLKQFEMTGKVRWQALDRSNMLLIQHLIQLEDPPQIQMSGFVCTEWNDWKIFEAAAGSGRTQRLQVSWTTIRSGTLYQR